MVTAPPLTIPQLDGFLIDIRMHMRAGSSLDRRYFLKLIDIVLDRRLDAVAIEQAEAGISETVT